MKWPLFFLISFFIINIVSAQDAYVKRSFAEKYHLMDSIRLSCDLARGVTTNEYKKAKLKIDNIKRNAIEHRDNELIGEIELYTIETQRLSGLTADSSAENRLLAQIHNAQKYKLHYLEAHTLQALGELYTSNKRINHALENYLAAYSIYSDFSVDEFPMKEECLFSLGSTYYQFGDNENALKYMKQAISVPNFVLSRSYTVYISIGLCYRNMGQYDSAEWYFRAIYDSAIVQKDTVWSGIVMGNIGITYYYQKRYGEAIPLLKKDIEASISHVLIRNAVGSMLILASIYYEQNDIVKAESVSLEALRFCKVRNFWGDYSLAEKMYTQLFRIYKAKKQTDLATMYADLSLDAKDSNNVKNNAMKFAKSQEKMDLVQRALANRQLQSQRKINFFLALVSVLLLVIGILAYINQRITARLNKQVLSQKKEVEQLNDVKDRIFSVISHDMRTPVNSLIAFTELLERGNISEAKMAAYAAALKHNLGYTARLLENLLNWARTQMQGFKPVLETFSLLDAMGQVMELGQHEADKKGVQISKELEHDFLVYADLNMFLLVMRNLLNNAIKYTPKGGVISLTCAKVDDMVKIRVKDSGVGMTQEMVDSFNNGNNGIPLLSTPGTNHEKGTGLGLMLSKTFVELMNGKILLESKDGTAFTVLLPVGH